MQISFTRAPPRSIPGRRPADWQIPIFKWFALQGEAYRGRALGGFGGGAYKDIFTGIDSVTGLSRTTGVETAGGWSQLKFIPSSTLQVNAAFGMDDAFTSNFDGFNLPPDTQTQLNTQKQFRRRQPDLPSEELSHPLSGISPDPDLALRRLRQHREHFHHHCRIRILICDNSSRAKVK